MCLDWGLSMGWEPIAFMALCSPPRTKARCSLKSKYRHIKISAICRKHLVIHGVSFTWDGF